MKQIIISAQSQTKSVCIVENKKLVEFWVERESRERIVGNIYLGKVMNVLPGMDSAFVNIGLERNAFLYAGDVLGFEEANKVEIKNLNIKIGDDILVQVVKDQFGNKGARITMNISLAGRGLILMPQIDYVGVSRKIVDESVKQELVEYVDSIRKPGHGYIIRTQATSCSKEELYQEAQELEAKWEAILEQKLKTSAPNIIYQDKNLTERAVRDMLRSDVDEVIVDDEKTYNELKAAFPHVCASKPDLFKLYSRQDKQIFISYNLKAQLDGLLERKVVMDNGAYLVIDRTEALTVIDVNTGKYVGEKDLSETLFETNKIAAVEIARQLRLRNIGGIVVVDFIDMDKQEHIDAVMEILRQELNKDRIKTSLIDMTPLGLVEITRKKTTSMLSDVLLQPCPYCGGNAYIYSDEHVAETIKHDLRQLFVNEKNSTVIITVAPSVFNKIFAYRLFEKECMAYWQDKRIYIVPNSAYHIEKYDITVKHSAIIDLPNEAKLLY